LQQFGLHFVQYLLIAWNAITWPDPIGQRDNLLSHIYYPFDLNFSTLRQQNVIKSIDIRMIASWDELGTNETTRIFLMLCLNY
jgi:hypothetical protein